MMQDRFFLYYSSPFSGPKWKKKLAQPTRKILRCKISWKSQIDILVPLNNSVMDQQSVALLAKSNKSDCLVPTSQQTPSSPIVLLKASSAPASFLITSSARKQNRQFSLQAAIVTHSASMNEWHNQNIRIALRKTSFKNLFLEKESQRVNLFHTSIFFYKRRGENN